MMRGLGSLALTRHESAGAGDESPQPLTPLPLVRSNSCVRADHPPRHQSFDPVARRFAALTAVAQRLFRRLLLCNIAGHGALLLAFICLRYDAADARHSPFLPGSLPSSMPRSPSFHVL